MGLNVMHVHFISIHAHIIGDRSKMEDMNHIVMVRSLNFTLLSKRYTHTWVVLIAFSMNFFFYINAAILEV